MLLEYEPPLQAGVLISPTQPLGTGNAFNTGDAPEFSQKFYTTVVVKSTRDHIVLPHNANLGSIQPMSADHNEDSAVYREISPPGSVEVNTLKL